MTRCLNANDIIIGLFIVFLSIIGIVFSALLPRWWLLILINFGVLTYLWLTAWAKCRTGNVLVRWLHDWNTIPLLIFCFKEVYFLIHPIYRGRIFDSLLIAIDRRLFGVDPTVWLTGYSRPYLTEILQVAYSLFYVLFLIIGCEIYRRNDMGQFSRLRFAIAYGFILSYLGYFLLPAVGPRFTLHDYARIDIELPGAALTPFLRWFVDSGDSIPVGASNDVARAMAQRDAFPSGHTMMTLVLIVLGFRWRTRSRFFILAAGTLLIAATVYLRYHYVIDVAAGAALAVLCLRTTHGFYDRICRALPGVT
jgi:membrane-associated phospholipid phosphatase